MYEELEKARELQKKSGNGVVLRGPGLKKKAKYRQDNPW